MTTKQSDWEAIERAYPVEIANIRAYGAGKQQFRALHIPEQS